MAVTPVLRKKGRCTESGLSARFTLFFDDRTSAHEPQRRSTVAWPTLDPGPVAGLPGHARAVRDRHLPAGLRRHRAHAGRHAGADAADPVGLPVRLRADEPVPRRAVRQLRPPAGGAVGAGDVLAGLGWLRAGADDRLAGLLPRAAGLV